MSTLLTAHSLSKSYGTQVLFQNISFTISAGDRIGIIGPNGAGKSSLIKILAGSDDPDSGYLSKRQMLQVGYASQSPEFPPMSIEAFLLGQVPELDERSALTRAGILLGKAEFADFSADASLLSGGWKKRLDIVAALMNEPDLLLLDEPTNHLDLEGIVWLEMFLKRLQIPYVVISHDRYFLESVTNRIIELNRCYPEGLLQAPGTISKFLEHKEAFLVAQEEKIRSLSHKVRDEIDWLRTSPKARTTKSEARIREANRLINELSEVKQRTKVQEVGIDFSASERETRKLIVAKNVSKELGGRQLFKHVDFTLSPGTRLGILGKNGTGKSTLLKILAGIVPQDMGKISYADDLHLVYFDQHREQLDPNLTLKEALCPNSETVNYRGQSIHVNGWAKRFLFPPDRLNIPIRCLSGGERARILVAKLMLEPADVLFLDEPTNDLDIPTLELIEESLSTFAGAVVLISHDRCLMDRICNRVLVLGEGEHHFYASFSQWESAKKPVEKEKPLPKKEAPKTSGAKLSYKEKRELDMMEQTILEAEAEISRLEKLDGNLEIYQQMGKAHEHLEGLYQRWQVLLDKAK
ncbi:MAG: ABC-F family ATP-binding cassette domain-containing protein [Verrucomicrobia bacterium]|nr:ABC-F family ATP-binding cassette domain-containing protein [Verrucomicrobiota bacterium]